MKTVAIERGTLVISLAGHDGGKAFAVLKTEGEYVYLADGRTRKISSPKRKKIKHIKPLNVKIDLDAYERSGGLTDGALIKEIKKNLNKNGG